MAQSDSRYFGTVQKEIRDNIAMMYNPLYVRLMAGAQGNLRKHDVDLDKVITIGNFVDDASFVPSKFNWEMNKANHVKTYPTKSEFIATSSLIIFSAPAAKGISDSTRNQIIRLANIKFDKDLLFGADGNKGLVNGVADDFRIVNTSVALPAASSAFGVKAKAVDALFASVSDQISATSGAGMVRVIVRGAALWNYLRTSYSDTSTDNSINSKNIFQVASESLGRLVQFEKIETLLDNGTDMSLTFVAEGAQELDYVTFPIAESYPNEVKDTIEFAVERYTSGSVQMSTRVRGGIINQPITIS